MPKIRAVAAAARTDEARMVGRRLAEARGRVGLSQAQAAKALAVPQSLIAKLELGQRQLRFVEALRLASLYSIAIADLDPSPPVQKPRSHL